MAGLIKTALALTHRELPPSLNFAAPNPRIDFAAGPFFVNTRLVQWPSRNGAPRRAGVSSFGIGGTNAHVVLEEAPPAEPSDVDGQWHLLAISARTEKALTVAAANLAAFLDERPGIVLADVAFTLAVGRHAFDRRRFVLARDKGEAARLLRGEDKPGLGAPPQLLEVGVKWAGGGVLNPEKMFSGRRRRRVILPTYPFERQRFWIEPAPVEKARQTVRKRTNVAEWGYQSSWKRAASSGEAHKKSRFILWFGDLARAEAIAAALTDAGCRVMVEGNPDRASAVLAELKASGHAPDEVVHSWCFGPAESTASFEDFQRVGYERLLTIVNALRREGLAAGRQLTVVATGVADVTDIDVLIPSRATLLGLALVIPQEFPGLVCRVIDAAPNIDAAALAQETASLASDAFVALRGSARWVHGYEPLGLDVVAGAKRLREHGVYLITGGLGGIGLIVAEYLARTVRARLILAARHGLPPRSEWPRLRSGSRLRFDLASDGAALAAAGMLTPDSSGTVTETDTAGFIRETDALCAVLLYRYLADGAGTVEKGGRVAQAKLRERLGVQPPFWRLFSFALSVLESEGYLRLEGNDVVWSSMPSDVPTTSGAVEAFAASRPDLRQVAALLGHCAGHYPDALRGREPAIGVLYSETGLQLLAGAGREIARYSNKDVAIDTLRQMVERLVASSGGRRVRILEVGVGDGLLAGRIVPGLRGRNAEYTATDISRAFVVKAEQAAAAAGLDGVSFGVLDIARDPAAQGFELGCFDLIVALDVVHATPRVAETLGHLKRLLAPGGVLGVLEKVRQERLIDIVWGLAEGWWHFEDADLRLVSPLMPAAKWERVLSAAGFSSVMVLPQGGVEREKVDYAFLVAQSQHEGQVDAGEARTLARIAAVERIEKWGAEVVIEEVDVASMDQMRAMMERVDRRFGEVHGVVHAAGVTGASAVFNMLPEADLEQAAALSRPKAGGAHVLSKLLAGRPTDFCLMISSNASVLGGLGLGGYSAANAFLDVFAAEQRRQGRSEWVSSNWDGWPTEEHGASVLRTSIDQFAMTRAEAEMAFAAVLTAPVPQVIVSSGDLTMRRARWAQTGNDAANPQPSSEAANAVPGADSPMAASFHARPALPYAYVEPRTDDERLVAKVWSELLGLELVGADDNFFDLDGDSLLGTQVLARLRRDAGVSLSMAAIFEAPTVVTLAARVGSTRAVAQVGGEEEEEGVL